MGTHEKWSTENVARYMAKAPVSLGRIRTHAGTGQVLYHGDRVHPGHGADFRLFDPLEFIAPACRSLGAGREVVSHIPDSYEKTTIYYGVVSGSEHRRPSLCERAFRNTIAFREMRGYNIGREA